MHLTRSTPYHDAPVFLSCRLQYWHTIQLESLSDPADSSAADSGAEHSTQLPTSPSQPSGLECPCMDAVHNTTQQPTCCCDDSVSSQATQAVDWTGSDQASTFPDQDELSAGGRGPVLPFQGRNVLVPLGGGKDSLTVFELLKVSMQALAGACLKISAFI